MIVRVTDIPAEGLDLDYLLDAEALTLRASEGAAVDLTHALPPRYRFQDPVAAHFHFEREGSTVFLTAELSASLLAQCSRCIDEVIFPLEVPMSMVLKPGSKALSDVDAGEDLSLGYYQNGELDPTELGSERLMISLPFTVVCNENCKGLCAHCGANRNTSSCSCETSATDTGKSRPFAVLAELKLRS